MPKRACVVCSRTSDQARCPKHRKTFKQRRGISSGSKAASINAAVLRRDGYRCTYRTDGRRCTETSDLKVDHIIPVISGGTWAMDNLQTLCKAHHDEKSLTDGSRVAASKD